MNESQFWSLIAQVDRDALTAGDEAGAVEPLAEALGDLDADSILLFQEHLAQALYLLDGRQFADCAGESGQSDDGFLYSRCFVVGSGRVRFDAVLKDPSKMPDSTNEWFEALLYVAEEVWANATESDPDDFDFETSVSYESGSNQAQW